MAELRSQTLRAAGGSMAPFIPSGSLLTVCEYAGGRLSVGDVVAFPGDDGVIAHRVVGVEGDPPRQRLRVRGDAQQQVEAIEQDAVIYVVLEVARRGIRYRTADRTGRWIARIALRGGASLDAARGLLSILRGVWPR